MQKKIILILLLLLNRCKAPLGIDEAIKRGKKYREIGADVVFVEAPHFVEELSTISSQIDAPLVANMIEEVSHQI